MVLLIHIEYINNTYYMYLLAIVQFKLTCNLLALQMYFYNNHDEWLIEIHN